MITNLIGLLKSHLEWTSIELLYEPCALLLHRVLSGVLDLRTPGLTRFLSQANCVRPVRGLCVWGGEHDPDQYVPRLWTRAESNVPRGTSLGPTMLRQVSSSAERGASECNTLASPIQTEFCVLKRYVSTRIHVARFL